MVAVSHAVIAHDCVGTFRPPDRPATGSFTGARRPSDGSVIDDDESAPPGGPRAGGAAPHDGGEEHGMHCLRCGQGRGAEAWVRHRAKVHSAPPVRHPLRAEPNDHHRRRRLVIAARLPRKDLPRLPGRQSPRAQCKKLRLDQVRLAQDGADRESDRVLSSLVQWRGERRAIARCRRSLSSTLRLGSRARGIAGPGG